MTVDISKIRPGDTLHVAVQAVCETPYGTMQVDFRRTKAFVNSSDIIAHIPKPREWKVGDQVAVPGIDGTFTIRAIDDGEAWLSPQCVVRVSELVEPT